MRFTIVEDERPHVLACYLHASVACASIAVCASLGCGGEGGEVQCHYALGEAREGIANDAFAYVEEVLKLRAAVDELDEQLLGERRALAGELKVDTERAVDEVDAQIVAAVGARVTAATKAGCVVRYESDFDPSSDAPFGSKPPVVTYAIECAGASSEVQSNAASTTAIVRSHLPKVLEIAAHARHVPHDASKLCERGKPLLRAKRDNEEMVSFAEAKCAWDDVCAMTAGGPKELGVKLVAAARGTANEAPVAKPASTDDRGEKAK